MEQSYDPKQEFSADLRFAHRRAEREGRARVASFTLKPPANATPHDPTPAAIFLAFLHCSQRHGVRSEVHEHQLGVYLLRALTSSGVPPGTYPQAASFFAALVALLRSLPPSSRPQLFRIAAVKNLAAFGVVSLPASVCFPPMPIPFPSAAAVASNVPPPLADLDVTLHPSQRGLIRDLGYDLGTTWVRIGVRLGSYLGTYWVTYWDTVWVRPFSYLHRTCAVLGSVLGLRFGYDLWYDLGLMLGSWVIARSHAARAS